MTSDRIAYQTYNDVQSINAHRRDMWTVIAEARQEAKAKAKEQAAAEAKAKPPSREQA